MLRSLALLVLLVTPGVASPSGGFDLDGTYLPAGVTLGWSPSLDRGFLLGGELSLVELEDGLWYGGYLDVVHSFGDTRTTRVSGGPEGGWLFGGLDAGVLVDLDTDQVGLRGRALLSFIGSAYFGGAWLPDTGAEWELGLLLKIPLPAR